MLKRSEILQTADKLVGGDREQDYGSPRPNFDLIAKFWNIYLESTLHTEYELEASDVCTMMVLLKLARRLTGDFKEDTYFDMAGYVALAGELDCEEFEERNF